VPFQCRTRLDTLGPGLAEDLEVTHHIRTGLTEDHREAAKAFVERREPRFTGR
jgi:hypothetical protein